MKLSISNIAWSKEHDQQMYSYLKEIGFDGLEIAPTRIFPKEPYERIEDAKSFAQALLNRYNIYISSMQSILFGRSERLFGIAEEREFLSDYTKKAIEFASAIGCKNLVFGSPKNRVIDKEDDYHIAVDFFSELGEYALEKGTVLSIEPNPVIYGTNFINYTEQALQLVNRVNCNGFKVNIDMGTIIQSQESLSLIGENLDKINHIHISEPNLAFIEKRQLHNELAGILIQKEYNRFVSIEMKKLDDIEEIKMIMTYLKRVFSCKLK
jgi:sugar phosphate isomerase/epimerase